MTPYEVYRFYLAIKLHFTTEKYDVFEHRGRLKGENQEKFESSGLNTKFRHLAKKLATPHDAVQYFVACFAYDANVFETDQADAADRLWRSNKERSTQLILDDIEKLIDNYGSVEATLENDPCKLQSLVSGAHINVETAVALNRRFKFTDTWKNNFAYKGLAVKIMKLDKFVKYREEKVNEILNCHVEEA